MKRIVTLLLLALFGAFAEPAGATCTTPPIVVSSAIGSKSASAPNAEYISMAQPHTSPTVERYSLDVFTNFGGPSKLTFGSGSGIDVRFGPECNTPLGGYECVTTLPPQRMTSVSFAVYASDPPITRVFVNGYKTMEWYNAFVAPAGYTTTWTDGVGRIYPGTRAEANTFRLEGWDTVNGVTTWKSVKFTVYGECGPF